MYVYFIRAGNNGPIKIGVADNVEKRVETLQTGNAVELIVIAVIKCSSRSAAFNKEAAFHKMFASKRIRGEWFRGGIRINQLSELKEGDRQELEDEFLCKESDRDLLNSCPFD